MFFLNPRHTGALGVMAILAMATASPLHAQSDSSVVASPAPEHHQVLRPGDVIRLKIWREPELSGDYIVDIDGNVIFPMIGPYRVVDESPESLKEELLEAYREYLRNPSIEIMPLRRVNVLGAVKAPGLYPIDATMTLADVLALAGGSTPQGDPDKIKLIRDGEAITTRLSQRSRVIDLPIRSGDQLFVPERNWVSRNSGVVAATISASVSLIIALIRN